MRKLRYPLIILYMILLSACMTMPAKQAAFNQNIPWSQRQQVLRQIKHWHLQGAIAINTTQKNFTASLDWRQQPQQYRVTIFGPLGIGTVQIAGKPHLVVLRTADNQLFTARSPNQLLQQQLGWHLPITNLYYWIRGLPAPGTKSVKSFDAYHHIIYMQQQGWNIRYLQYTGAYHTDLPCKIFLNNPRIHLKIVITRWT
jgi:outer membrane lipoprotein LolB